MDSILVPITLGAAMVLIIDVIRRTFPNLDIKWVKVITVVLALIISGLTLLAQTNPTIQTAINNVLIVLGTSQSLYALVWKDTDAHLTLVGGTAEDGGRK